MMQQNRDRNGRPRNTRPYDLNRDVARTSAPSQNNTPRSTGSSRYGYNGEPLSRPPSRSANGSVRSSRADNSIQFPTQSQTRRPAQGSNTTQHPSGSRPKNAKSGGKQRRPANNARSGQSSRKNQNAQNHPNRQHPAGSGQRLRPAQSAPQQSPARREQRKKRKVTRATLRRRRMLRRLTAFAMLLCVIGAGIYLTMTMLFRISAIQVQTADGTQVTEIAGYSADSILQTLGVQVEENIFSFDSGAKAAELERQYPLLESIRVVRDYPNTVVVQVTEATPTYAVQAGSSWLTLSDKFKILSADPAQPDGLCTLYGGEATTAAPGEQLSFATPEADSTASTSAASDSRASGVVDETDAKMSALATLQAKLDEYGMRSDVTRIEFADTEQIAFLYQDRISVLLGTLNDLDYKLDRARYMLNNEDGKGCAATDTGRLDFSHVSAGSTRKIYFAQGDPVLPSGYVVPEKVEPETPEETADSSLTDEEAPQAAPAADTAQEEPALTDPARMTANEDENPI